METKKKWIAEKRKWKTDWASFVISFWQLRRRPLWILGFIRCVYKRSEWFLSLFGMLILKQFSVTPFYRAVWAGWPWDGTWWAQELLYNVTLLLHEEAVLQSLLWLTSLHNPDALLHVQMRPVLGKPLSPPACELFLGIPAFQVICMRSAFFLRFWRETKVFEVLLLFWLINLWNPSKLCFQVFLYNHLSFRFVFIVSLLFLRKKSASVVKFGKGKNC